MIWHFPSSFYPKLKSKKFLSFEKLLIIKARKNVVKRNPKLTHRTIAPKIYLQYYQAIKSCCKKMAKL